MVAKQEADEYPEPGELIIGTVKDIFNQGAFITLDEYEGKKGMLHISEITLKWVRNIRDYVKEKQKVVLIVLRTDPSRGHIDLSLRRVTDAQRKNKLQQVKQSQRSEKLLELAAEELGVDYVKLHDKIAPTLNEYGSLYAGLEAISADEAVADELDVPEKWRKKLVELTQKSIKPPRVEVVGYVNLQSFESDGVDVVKAALDEIRKHKPKDCDLDLNYVSAPTYRVKVMAADYKTAEKALKNCTSQGLKYIQGRQGLGEFHRELD